MKKRLFIDMDGVIAVWDSSKSLVEVLMPYYFLNCKAEEKLIESIKLIIQADIFDVYILSAANTRHIRECKKKWLKKYLPEIKESHIIFARTWIPKSNFIKCPAKDDLLLDDYSVNLHAWHGQGVKFRNKVNGTKGSWKGKSISHLETKEEIYSHLFNLAQ